MKPQTVIIEIGQCIKDELVAACEYFDLEKEEIIKAATPFSPPRCGIYFFVLDNEIVYIGQSMNVENRMQQHMRSKWYKDAIKDGGMRITFLPAKREDLDLVESFYVDFFKPKGNKVRRTWSYLVPTIIDYMARGARYNKRLSNFLTQIITRQKQSNGHNRKYFTVAGACATGACDCRLYDGIPLERKDAPPRHEGCTCYMQDYSAHLSCMNAKGINSYLWKR